MPIASPSRSSMPCRRGFGQLAAGAVAACFAGGKLAHAEGNAAVRFSLDRRFDALTAPFLAAQDKGYFGTEGLDVVIEPGNGARAMLQRLASGVQDAGFGDVNALIRFRDENPSADLKAVMIIHDRPGYALIGRKSRGITTAPTSLEGRKLGTASIDASFAQWPIFKSLNKIDDSKIRIETIGLPVREPMLASGEIDALFAFGPSTAVSLRARGVPADDIVLMEMADHGLLLYGSAVIVSGKFAAAKPDALRGLVRMALAGSIGSAGRRRWTSSPWLVRSATRRAPAMLSPTPTCLRRANACSERIVTLGDETQDAGDRGERPAYRAAPLTGRRF